MPDDKLKPIPTHQRPAEEDDPIEVGQWYWVSEEDSDPWLGCVVRIGSNYVKLEGVEYHERVHIDEFDERCELEPDHDIYIQAQIDLRQANVNSLMGKVKQLTANLGVTRGALPEGDAEATTTALAVAHGTDNIKKHKKALIKAKEKTLPELFKEIKREHEEMARWMKAELIPMQAKAKAMEGVIEVIEDRIFTVELYAGLVEELAQIREGEPADNDTPISLFQRRHYMDEECLYNYSAGGMEFKNIKAFDRWLCRKDNLYRLLPHERCVVAFQVRRERKDRELPSDFRDFINMVEIERMDESTFLYIRNGEQVFRLATSIEFDKQLFPDTEHSILLGQNRLYAEVSWRRPKEVITAERYEGMMEDRAREYAEYLEKEKAWEAMSEKEREGKCSPWYHEPHEKWVEVTPETVWYDDVMKKIAKEAVAHNRIAVVLQGLLDRSPAFHPHPPWQLWTPEGFQLGLKLIYDDSKALVDGDPPDFEAYRTKLNESIKKGTLTVGQEDAWMRVEAKKENDRQRADWRIKYASNYKRYKPYGNPGPGLLAKTTRATKNNCSYRWERQRLTTKWVPNPDRPGYLMPDPSGLPATFTCSKSRLLNVDAYTPGDYKQFYADPRTRADYLKWAPLLLACEDHYAKKRKRKKR